MVPRIFSRRLEEEPGSGPGLPAVVGEPAKAGARSGIRNQYSGRDRYCPSESHFSVTRSASDEAASGRATVRSSGHTTYGRHTSVTRSDVSARAGAGGGADTRFFRRRSAASLFWMRATVSSNVSCGGVCTSAGVATTDAGPDFGGVSFLVSFVAAAGALAVCVAGALDRGFVLVFAGSDARPWPAMNTIPTVTTATPNDERIDASVRRRTRGRGRDGTRGRLSRPGAGGRSGRSRDGCGSGRCRFR